MESDNNEPQHTEVREQSAPSEQESSPPPLVRRIVVQAPQLAEESLPLDSAEVLIKAQPSTEGDQCKFMINRPLLAGHSWWFPNFESARNSSLAETLFSLNDVETLLVDHSTVVVTRKDKTQKDWLPLAKEIGASIRKLVESDSKLISEEITQKIPSEEKIREDIQKIIDVEVNPGVAGHGGQITLTEVKGNTITILMGGGCQGCSAADLTLKQGIHNSFRKAVPMVGAIYDETDHSAGSNPYYS